MQALSYKTQLLISNVYTKFQILRCNSSREIFDRNFPTLEWEMEKRKTRGPWWPCNAHLSNIALWEPDLELIKANILIIVQNDYINK